MFGFVMADLKELDKQTRQRYQSVYCGICRQIRQQSSSLARLGLRYDMAFLALLLMSLYEPEETAGTRACGLHPVKPRHWVDNEYVRYGADMNVALGYYKSLDDQQDDGSLTAQVMAGVFQKGMDRICREYPRQCDAMAQCIGELNRLERENCPNPDLPANCFGKLMGELLVYREDLWSPALREMGMALGRFIYLADAVVDYPADSRKKRYNPLLAMGEAADFARWEQYLVMAMGKCTDCFERLPLVQDKALLDNILYSGVWIEYGRRLRLPKKDRGGNHDPGSV